MKRFIGALLWASACDGRVVTLVEPIVAPTCRVEQNSPPQAPPDPITRSHWLQPFRSWTETFPARRMREAVGMRFVHVEPDVRPAFAKALGQNGLRRVQLEWSWTGIDYDDPTRWQTPGLRTEAQNVKDAGLRPVILLWGHEGIPGPRRDLDLVVTSNAVMGATRVQLDLATARKIVIGKTGFNRLSPGGGRGAEVLVTAVDAQNVATLSKPLPVALEPGRYPGMTLKYEPFRRPTLPGGKPNPIFEETLEGWLAYVGAITREALTTFGPGGFDLALWWSLSGGGAFIDINNYYEPDVETAPLEQTYRTIVERTVAYLRGPALRAGNIGIVNDFINRQWSETAATQPAGLTAIGRHVSARGYRFPSASFDPDGFTPTYDANFPELPLTAIESATILRDLAPRWRPPQNASTPTIWLTSVAFDQDQAQSRAGAVLSVADTQKLTAKILLRSYAAYVGKGAAAVILNPDGDNYGRIFDRSDPTGGPVLSIVGRFMRQFDGPDTLPDPARTLELTKVSACDPGIQFPGNGTASSPDLKNSEVIGFFPFVRKPKEFVAAVYVMTRNVAQPFRPERFVLTLDGVAGDSDVGLYDPIADVRSTPRVVDRARNTLTVEVELTDAPRLLILGEP